ncbi:hypothetical protein ACFWUP_15615 [Nocardia sp. NPDC058658]|uniref:hypothetical protein n=1 Tax=Nocardia sp. NPDC058658 TaxID=3346580 RepID=UPI0036493A38
MDESLTAPEAQRKIYAYMSEALTGLPVSTSLAKLADVPNLASHSAGPPLSVPCWDGNLQSEGPHYITSAYWIVGVPPSAGKEYFDQLSETWKNKGWNTSEKMIRVTEVELPDGFGLTLNAGPDYRFMSLTGHSPCMPDSAIDGMENDPLIITRP